MLKNINLILALFVFLALNPLSVFAKEYPKKPVSMIVAYSPGGGTDTAARVIAKYVEPYLKQRLVITNRPGAGGQIGFTALSKARNNGYTLGFINVPSILLIKSLRDNVAYKMSDFEPIANIQLDPVVIAVNADSPYKNLKDFLAAAKKNPGKLNVGGDGPQSNNQLQVLVAEDKLGMDVNFVSFSGSGPAITATLGGQVDASVPSATAATSLFEDGRIRILAVFAPKRYEYFPDVPTVFEATGKKVANIGVGLRGIVAPKGISKAQKQFLQDAFAKTLRDKEFLKYAKKTKLPLQYMNPQEFSDYLKEAEENVKKNIHLLKK